MLKNLDHFHIRFKDSDVTDRVLLPIDGVLNINYDNKRTFVDKRSFWRSILLDGTGTKTQLQLQLESYVLQKQVVNEIIDVQKYVKHQLLQHGFSQCLTSVRNLAGGHADSKEGKEQSGVSGISKSTDRDNAVVNNNDVAYCNELRDLLDRQWEEKRYKLVCIIRPINAEEIQRILMSVYLISKI